MSRAWGGVGGVVKERGWGGDRREGLGLEESGESGRGEGGVAGREEGREEGVDAAGEMREGVDAAGDGGGGGAQLRVTRDAGGRVR